MQKRVVLLGIIVENTAAVEQLNILLHAHNEYIIGVWDCHINKKALILSVSFLMPRPTLSVRFPAK